MTAEPETPSGVHINAPQVTVTFSGDVAREALASIERMWQEGLQWAGQYPLLFIALLIFLAFAYYQRSRASVERRSMELQFRQKRETARKHIREKQQDLPLLDNRQRSEKGIGDNE